MASREGIAKTIRFLHALYPNHDVSDLTGEAWLIVWSDISDEALAEAARICSQDDGRKFFPTVGELRATLRKMQPVVDATTILRAIEGMGSYNAHTGWEWPRVEAVRERFGAQIAAAYGDAGPSRFASENETTRAMALREFAEAMRDTPMAATNLQLKANADAPRLGVLDTPSG